METINIVPSELINHEDVFVREPVDVYSKIIEKEKNSKIIVTGGRSTGKTTLLYQLQNRNIGTDTPFFYTKFESENIKIFKDEPEIFDENFFKHYYEILLANKLLTHIKKYYELTYHVFFEKEHQNVENLIKQTDDFINNIMHDKSLLVKRISQKEIIGEILDKLKKIKDVSYFNLCIDRFDCTNNSDILSQKILSQYFDLFNKVIITSDDEKIIKMVNKVDNDINCSFHKFCCLDTSKMHSFQSIKLLLLKRIALLDRKNASKSISDNWLTDDFIKKMMEETNGKISIMISIIKKLYNYYLDSKNVTNKIFENYLNEEIEYVRELRRENPRHPKLYL